MKNILLRDGTIAQSNLDRLVNFDSRSKQYPIRGFTPVKKERSFTWKCDTHLDQGEEGACVGFGITHELMARPAAVPYLDNRYAHTQIYWPAQTIDPWEGGSYPDASPFYEGTSTLAGVKIAQSYGWFDGYRWAFGLTDLILGVGYNGPAVIGVMWYEGMVNADAIGYIHATGKTVGGHCLLCKAVDVKKQRFTLHNSWGIGWGMNGDCYISFDDMQKLLYEEGEAVFFIKRHKKEML
jgi:hypothetical protein